MVLRGQGQQLSTSCSHDLLVFDFFSQNRERITHTISIEIVYPKIGSTAVYGARGSGSEAGLSVRGRGMGSWVQAQVKKRGQDEGEAEQAAEGEERSHL